jgi:hypothetical protein
LLVKQKISRNIWQERKYFKYFESQEAFKSLLKLLVNYRAGFDGWVGGWVDDSKTWAWLSTKIIRSEKVRKF